jgi:hypothetical protein
MAFPMAVNRPLKLRSYSGATLATVRGTDSAPQCLVNLSISQPIRLSITPLRAVAAASISHEKKTASAVHAHMRRLSTNTTYPPRSH